MADPRPALTEESLRETKENLVGAINRWVEVGGGIPDTRAAEDLIAPILAKSEEANEEDRRRDMVRKDVNETFRADRKDRFRKRAEEMGYTFIHEELGTVDVDWNRGIATTTVDLAKPGVEGPAAQATRKRFRELARLPEWRQRVLAVFEAPLSQSEKGAAYLRILHDSVRVLGDPRFGDI